MHKILIVFGTRPEAIKLAPVIKCLDGSHSLESKVCVTAQHRKLLDQVLGVFNVTPDYDLNIMQDNQDLFSVTARLLTGLKEIIRESEPSLVLVQGDTTTTFVASLASFYFKVPVGHIEAGLRTDNKYSPFPEEINRRMTTLISDFNFAPTEIAANNLLKEGVAKEKIYVTGNTVVDALFDVLCIIKDSKTEMKLKGEFEFLKTRKKFVLITGHRRESFGEGFKNICTAIRKLAESLPEYNFVYPVHLNPNVRKPVQEILRQDRLSNIYLIEPVDYLSFVFLMDRSYMILTDSGGVQEEALSFGKPVLVMRDTTERPEGIQAGAVQLVGTGEANIYNKCRELLRDATEYNRVVKIKNPYGDGKAASRIVGILSEKFL